LRVPFKHIENGHKLGNWITTHRAKKKAGTLASDAERRLNEIGFIWNGYEGHLGTMITALTKFKEREGHWRVPARHVEDGQKLGTWICMSRYKKRKGTLIFEQERLLNEMGFVWDAHSRKGTSIK
jgi:ferredoxin-thioredoxin reductase catalytic subunit